jgi:trehalose 6-phosphate phosphatase
MSGRPESETLEVPGSGGGLPKLDGARDALFLDIDGTLIDIAPTPESVIVPETLKLSLSRLQERLGGALAVSSGRTIPSIDELFAPLKLVASGCHGAEIRLDPKGKFERLAIPMSAVEKAALSQIAKIDQRLRMEDKIYTFAIHYRSAPELQDKLSGMVTQWVASAGRDLEIVFGKMVIEIKPPGFNKGTGLRYMMQHAPFGGRRPIFLGDDTTDEDALAVLPEFGGLGISVGSRRLPGASRAVGAPRDVRQWLAALAGVEADLSNRPPEQSKHL